MFLYSDAARKSSGLPGRRPLERNRRSLSPAGFRGIRGVVDDVDDLRVVQPDLKMRTLETESHVVPAPRLADHREPVAILEIDVVLRAAVPRGQPVDVPADRLGHGAVHDDADILAGFAPPEIELIAIAKRHAAVERARLVFAEICLRVAEFRRAFGARFGQHEVELELDIPELLDCRQAATALPLGGRHARNHAALDFPASVFGVGRRRREWWRWRLNGSCTSPAGRTSAAAPACEDCPAGEILAVEERSPIALRLSGGNQRHAERRSKHRHDDQRSHVRLRLAEEENQILASNTS